MFTRARIVINFSGGANGGLFAFRYNGVRYEFEFNTFISPGIRFYRDAATLAAAIQLQLPGIDNAQKLVSVSRVSNQITILANDYGVTLTPVEAQPNSGVTLSQAVQGTGPSFTVGIAKVDVAVKGTATGSITLTPAGGNGGYTYLWSDGSTAASRSGLAAGTYRFTVTESGGLTRTFDVVVTEPAFTPLVITAAVQHATCFGSATGTVGLSAQGGSGGYVFRWEDGFVGPTRPNLRAGVYNVTATDSAGNTGTLAVTVNQNTQIRVVASVSEGNVTLAVSGGAGGYSYLWSDGATSANRTNLAPGTYTVTVTDSAGCVSVETVRLDEFQFWFSRNPVPLFLAASNVQGKPNLSFVCEVWVETAYKSNAYSRVAVLEQPADSRGRTVFDVRTLLDSYLEPFLPIGRETVLTRADSLFKRFYLKYTEKFGDPTPTEGTYTQVDVRYVLLGGLSFEEYSRRTFLTSYLPTKKPFFTWQANPKRAFADQPEYLMFMPDSFSLTSFTASCRVFFTDGASEAFTIGTASGVSRYELWCIPAGYGQLNLAARQPAKRVRSWEVYVTDGATLISEVRTYHLRTEPTPNRRYFLYQNSLGGLDTMAAAGKTSRELDPKSTDFERILQPDYRAADGEVVTSRRFAEDALKCSTGYLTPDELAAVADFAISERVTWYRETAGAARYLPGRLEMRNAKVLDELETENAVQFEFVLPKMTSYTPDL